MEKPKPRRQLPIRFFWSRAIWIRAICILAAVLTGTCLLIVSLWRDGFQEQALDTTAASLAARHPDSQSEGSIARVAGDLVRRREREHDRALDPASDGWTSEVVAGRLHAVVKLLAHSLSVRSLDRGKLESVFSAESSCTPLVPELREVIHDENVNIRCFMGDDSSSTSFDTHRYRGLDGWIHAVHDFQGTFASTMVRHHVKTVQVQVSSKAAQSEHQVELLARNGSSLSEFHFRWLCAWELRQAARPRLKSIETRQFRQATSSRSSPFFRDDTQAVLATSPVYQNQLRHGLNEWLTRVTTDHGMYVFAEYGVAVGDINGDGLDDVYVCQPGGLPNRLFVQTDDGAVQDDSAAAGVDWLDHCSSALIIDLDNDDDQDLLIAMESRCVVAMKNDGRGRFQVAAELPVVDRHVQGLSAADYDRDGDLDVYLTVGFADEAARPSEDRPAFVYYDANEGGANVLFRNDIGPDGWHFANVTRAAGLDQNNRRHSLASAWEDFDNDGDQDLYVANDYGQNCLYQNDGGHFHDVAELAGVVDHGSGMSVSWSDFDHDGAVDLYIGNMFSSAGQRIVRQPGFHFQDENARRLLQRFAKGNTLFRNLGNGRFDDVGQSLEVEMGRWAWSSVFTDVNNDGLDDLFVVNGYITNTDTRDL